MCQQKGVKVEETIEETPVYILENTPEIEILPTSETADMWVMETLKERQKLPAQKKKRAPKKHNHQTEAKSLRKDEIVYFFNRSKTNRRTGYTAEMLGVMFGGISRRTFQRYLDQLYKEGRAKRWRQSREQGEEIAYRDWYSSTANPDPKYVMWIALS